MPEFKPMKHSKKVFKAFSVVIKNACTVDKPSINAEQLLKLEQAIEQGRKAQQTKPVDAAQAKEMLLALSQGRSDSLVSVAKFKYSDKNYNAQAAKFDFACYLFSKLSLNQYNRLITQILTIDNGRVDNTFLRNNELVKYMLIVQMNHEQREGLPGHQTLIHFHWIKNQVGCSNDLLEIINFSLIRALNKLAENFENCEAINTMKEWSSDNLEVNQLLPLNECRIKSADNGLIRLKKKSKKRR